MPETATRPVAEARQFTASANRSPRLAASDSNPAASVLSTSRATCRSVVGMMQSGSVRGAGALKIDASSEI